jgi:acetyl-CoA acetyltransferase
VKRIYIASYHQSKLGKLFDMGVAEIVARCVTETCDAIGAAPGACDVTTVGVAGSAPFNEQGLTSGGLIAKGHPIGASSVAMVGWAAWQLRGKVPAELQVPNPRMAATFNIGGPICASVCTVLKPA